MIDFITELVLFSWKDLLLHMCLKCCSPTFTGGAWCWLEASNQWFFLDTWRRLGYTCSSLVLLEVPGALQLEGSTGACCCRYCSLIFLLCFYSCMVFAWDLSTDFHWYSSTVGSRSFSSTQGLGFIWCLSLCIERMHVSSPATSLGQLLCPPLSLGSLPLH